MDEVIRRARAEAAAGLRAELRDHLRAQPVEWLVERLLDHLVACQGLPLPPPAPATAPHRVSAVELTEAVLADFTAAHHGYDRERLVLEGYLVDPPAKGGPLLGPEHRTPAGEDLLARAKDVLHALLYSGSPDRVQRELLSLTVPRAKLPVFEFVREAATEISAEGTWTDPTGAAHDDRAGNTVVQVEYGEVAGELVGHGIVTALRLINELEVNEVVLYARMEDVEQSTLT
ncbi:hypothetical protein [Saccharothrix syringae]|uniref:Uncharacterized protein n=1 Tax=Saccharothrix syringae TaxID=103733 RepID=A0A5Q0GTM5_SACSY|nr:hypothetical protein [Saccharothrix syringae]QFZ17261.1 hypothetical protein EKG83_07080 [Saccharothrix syringae]